MRKSDPMYPIRDLIGDPGFRSKEDLGSFCLSVGLYHEKKAVTEVDPPRSWDPSRFDTWPMLEIIVHTKEPSIEDMSGIKHILYQYYLGGVEMVTAHTTGTGGLGSLKKLSRFIPP
jgi:hypothetical protein